MITASPSLSLSGAFRLWRGVAAPAKAPILNLAWTADGRTALEAALRHLGRSGRWLVPAYCCPALRQTFAAAGSEAEYYAVDETLQPSWDALKDRLEGEPAAGIVFVHYFGFRTDWSPLKALIESKGLAVIEDCAHLPMPSVLDPDMMESDARIYSLHKWLPIPHGGALMLKAPHRPAQLLFQDASPALRPQLLRACALALERASRLGLRGRLLSLPAFERRVESRDALEHVYGLGMDSRVAAFIQNEAPRAEEIRKKHRANYEALARMFANLREVSAWRPVLPADDCPFTFSLLIDPAHRGHLLSHCLRNGIQARVYWKTLPPAVLARKKFGAARRLSEKIVCLPIHYQLEPSELERIYDVICAAFRN